MLFVLEWLPSRSTCLVLFTFGGTAAFLFFVSQIIIAKILIYRFPFVDYQSIYNHIQNKSVKTTNNVYFPCNPFTMLKIGQRTIIDNAQITLRNFKVRGLSVRSDTDIFCIQTKCILVSGDVNFETTLVRTRCRSPPWPCVRIQIEFGQSNAREF